ncbi:hypothetical protein ATK17_2337 [Branchiibius hedensis]|uniref:Uncharacterized protein n=1 Tax=Branchiibius hedensis TaxID=672460 RepID=A0A2Y9C1V5_9MICO|nr:hypothetical protein [Branchiibius hedensis]PWJ26191.1 hypothetical protein ATK17_2337 [Branchiibius hedensis]SSA35003.1 hypothetical protein SAMN04489750_2337 [Branchiibius hedensis]
MFQLILPETMPDVLAAEGNQEAPISADAAATRTRADYGRVSRWALGLVGTAGATFAILLTGAALAMLETGDHAPAAAPFALVALAIGIPCTWLLFALHRSGRRLARAAGFWADLPYRVGQRTPTNRDWFAARYVSWEADLMLRMITVVFAALGAIFALFLTVGAIVRADPASFVIMAAAETVLLAAVCAGQFGGVQRIQNGYVSRDPATFARRHR